MKPPTRRIHRRSAFTLVELLTVITIIGILAAILIPVVGSVRRTARSAECQNNLRQLSLAIIQYTYDNKGLLPVERNVNPSPVGVEDPDVLVSWWMLIQKRLELHFPIAGEPNLFLCPEAASTFSVPARRTYGLNLAGAGGQDAVRLANISSPAQALLLGETKQNGNQSDSYTVIGFSSLSNGQLDWRHKGDTMNVSFADGSMRTLHKSTTADGSPSSLYRMLQALRQ